MKSWQTTVLGIAGALMILCTQAIALLDNDPTTVFELTQVLAAFAIFGIGLKARDNDKSSEDVGTK